MYITGILKWKYIFVSKTSERLNTFFKCCFGHVIFFGILFMHEWFKQIIHEFYILDCIAYIPTTKNMYYNVITNEISLQLLFKYRYSLCSLFVPSLRLIRFTFTNDFKLIDSYYANKSWKLRPVLQNMFVNYPLRKKPQLFYKWEYN